MVKRQIQKHKGRLCIIEYYRKDNNSNIISGEITAVTREHTIIAVNKESPEIFIKSTVITKIISDKKEMQAFKDENFISPRIQRTI